MTSDQDSPADYADNETRRRAALISSCQLSATQVDNILRYSQEESVAFGKAAVNLGLVTEKELTEADALAQDRTGSETATLIERAIHKLSGSRQSSPSASSALVSYKVRPSNELTLMHDPYGDRSEKIRALTTELLLLLGGVNQGCGITLLSPNGDEGRSQLAAELAIAFAQLDRRTLLVDADMRQPSQHQLFEGVEDRGGLSQALATGNAPELHAVEGLAQLHILMAGELPSNPLELLSTEYFKRLFTRWRRQYDFIVIDTPPITQFADGLAVVTVSGNALLLSRAQYTDYKGTKAMMRRLTATQAQILGAVINHF